MNLPSGKPPPGARQRRRHLRAQARRARLGGRAPGVRAAHPQCPAGRGAGLHHRPDRVGDPRHAGSVSLLDAHGQELRLGARAAAARGAARGARAHHGRHPQRLVRRLRLPRAPGAGGGHRQGPVLAGAARAGAGAPASAPPGRPRSRLPTAACSARSGSTARRSACRPRADTNLMARAAQLAGIAIERRRGEEALRGSEAKFRGLFESIAEGVYQSGRDGRLLSVNPAFVAHARLSTAPRSCTRCPTPRCCTGTRPTAREFAHARATPTARSAMPSSRARPRRPAAGGPGERASDARCGRHTASATRARSPTSPSASAPSRRCSPRRSARRSRCSRSAMR